MKKGILPVSRAETIAIYMTSEITKYTRMYFKNNGALPAANLSVGTGGWLANFIVLLSQYCWEGHCKPSRGSATHLSLEAYLFMSASNHCVAF